MIRFLLICLLCLFPLPYALEANTAEVVSKGVDEICGRLQNGENPENIFSILFQTTPDNEVHGKFLDPEKWLVGGDQNETSRYIGTLTFAQLRAPFFRISRAALSYSDESKYIPGILSTRVLSHERLSNGKEMIELEREREIPLALRALLPSANRYRLSNTITSKTDSWLLVRVKLDSSQNQGKKLFKSIEGFEYYRKISQDKVLVLMGGFALPATGPLATKTDSSKRVPKPLSKVTFGVLDKVVSTIDIRDKFYFEVSKAIIEGAYQCAAGLMQVTTEAEWKNKWIYQLTTEDSKRIFEKNKSILEKAKKNRWIEYQSN